MNKTGNEEIKYLIRITKRMIVTLFLVLIFVATFVKKGTGTNGGDLPKKEGALRQIQLSPVDEYGKLPLTFIPNEGQVDKRVKFYVRTPGYTLWLIKEGLVFDRINMDNGHERDVSRLIFNNINQNSRVLPLDVTCHKVNYLKRRNMSTWKLNISTAKAVLYRDIYSNIDLKVYGKTKQVEYDWIVKPGGNAKDISFTYRNVKSTRIDPEGNIVVETGFGELVHKKPVSYQESKAGGSEAKRQAVDVRFKKIGKNTYAFEVGEYDNRYELIIDPFVQLGFSTYLGGSGR